MMNGEEDAFYSQDVQIGQYNVADGFYTDIGEPYSFERLQRSRSKGGKEPSPFGSAS